MLSDPRQSKPSNSSWAGFQILMSVPSLHHILLRGARPDNGLRLLRLADWLVLLDELIMGGLETGKCSDVHAADCMS